MRGVAGVEKVPDDRVRDVDGVEKVADDSGFWAETLELKKEVQYVHNTAYTSLNKVVPGTLRLH